MIVRVAVPQRFQLKMAAGFGDMLFHRTNEVHYIGGTEVLPPPLTAGQEQELLAMLGKEGDAKARSQLIERNLRLVVYIAKKFDNTSQAAEPSGPGFCHVEEFTYLSVAKTNKRIQR